MIAEAEAGVRRYGETDVGGRYGKVFIATDRGIPAYGIHERALGDLLDPYRPGSATGVVNAVSRSVGFDAAGWTVGRLLSMAGRVEREARERERQG